MTKKLKCLLGLFLTWVLLFFDTFCLHNFTLTFKQTSREKLHIFFFKKMKNQIVNDIICLNRFWTLLSSMALEVFLTMGIDCVLTMYDREQRTRYKPSGQFHQQVYTQLLRMQILKA